MALRIFFIFLLLIFPEPFFDISSTRMEYIETEWCVCVCVCPVSIRIRERNGSNSTRNPFISFTFPSRWWGGGILILRRIFVTEYHERNWKMDALAMDIHIPFLSFWKHCSGKSCWMRRARCNWRFSNLASHETRKRSWQRKIQNKTKNIEKCQCQKENQ